MMIESLLSIDEKIRILMDNYVCFHKQGNRTYLFVALSEENEPHVLIGEIDTETEFAEDIIRKILIEEERDICPIRNLNCHMLLEDREHGYGHSYSFEFYDNDSMTSLCRVHHIFGSSYRYYPRTKNPKEDTPSVIYKVKCYEKTDSSITLELGDINTGLSSWKVGRAYSKNDKDILKEAISVVDHHYNILHPFIHMYKNKLAEHPKNQEQN